MDIPRRARPVTLGNIRASGLDVFAYCNICHRNRVMSSADLVARLTPALPVPAIGRRLKCSACGSKDVYTRPHWRPVAGYHYPAAQGSA